jgi:hypothetical protein
VEHVGTALRDCLYVVVDITANRHEHGVDMVRPSPAVIVVSLQDEHAPGNEAGDVVGAGSDHEIHACRIDGEAQRNRAGEPESETRREIPTRLRQHDMKPLVSHEDALDIGEEANAARAHSGIQHPAQPPCEVDGSQGRAVAEAQPATDPEDVLAAITGDTERALRCLRPRNPPASAQSIRKGRQSRAGRVPKRRKRRPCQSRIERRGVERSRDEQRASRTTGRSGGEASATQACNDHQDRDEEVQAQRPQFARTPLGHRSPARQRTADTACPRVCGSSRGSLAPFLPDDLGRRLLPTDARSIRSAGA